MRQNIAQTDGDFGINEIYISKDSRLWGRWFVSNNGVDQSVKFVRASSVPAHSEDAEKLADALHAKGDNAYCESLGVIQQPSGLGWEAKVKAGTFGLDELNTHARSAELIGMHRAYRDAERMVRTAELAVPAVQPPDSNDDYVAWCAYVNYGQDESGADITTIETCDSDREGAFKVYRRPDSKAEFNRGLEADGCDHCSADLSDDHRFVHVLCEKCYRRFDSDEYDRATAGLSEEEKALYPRHVNDPARISSPSISTEEK